MKTATRDKDTKRVTHHRPTAPARPVIPVEVLAQRFRANPTLDRAAIAQELGIAIHGSYAAMVPVHLEQRQAAAVTLAADPDGGYVGPDPRSGMDADLKIVPPPSDADMAALKASVAADVQAWRALMDDETEVGQRRRAPERVHRRGVVR